MKPSSWKSKWIKQRKKDMKNPDMRAYKYACSWGHIRIEKEKLSEPLPPCQACSLNNKPNSTFRYVGVHTLTRTDRKRSKF